MGNLSLESLTSLRKKMINLDKSKDTPLTREDFSNELGKENDADLMLGWFNEDDESSRIEYLEITSEAIDRYYYNIEEKVYKIFRIIDREGKGKLMKREAYEALKKVYGDNTSDLRALEGDYDFTGLDCIDINEFCSDIGGPKEKKEEEASKDEKK